MPAELRIAVPSATPSPPIQLASSGLPEACASGFMRSATCVGFASPCGAMMASRPSLAGSLDAISTAFTKRSASASASTSTGLLWLQCGERKPSNACTDSGERTVSSPPVAIRESVAKHSRTARVRDDRQARAARPRLLAQGLRHIKKVGEILHAQNAAAAEGCVQHIVASG